MQVHMQGSSPRHSDRSAFSALRCSYEVWPTLCRERPTKPPSQQYKRESGSVYTHTHRKKQRLRQTENTGTFV